LPYLNHFSAISLFAFLLAKVDIWAQLSHGSNGFALDLNETTNVVRQIGQRNVGFCPNNANAAKYQIVHTLLHKTENMLYTAAYP
jgi:hypothetical protein